MMQAMRRSIVPPMGERTPPTLLEAATFHRANEKKIFPARMALSAAC